MSNINRHRFRDPKVPSAREVLWFDFTNRLTSSETLQSVLSVTVAVSFGTDASPSSILNGSAQISSDGKSVLVPVQSGVSGVDYDVTVIAQSSSANKAPGMTGTLAVR